MAFGEIPRDTILVQIAYFGFGRDHLLGLTPLFDLNQENNIPTWYSGMVLPGDGRSSSLSAI